MFGVGWNDGLGLRGQRYRLGRRPRATVPAGYHGIFGIMFTRISFVNANPLQPADYPRSISIDFLNFSPKIKRISGAQKKQLMDSGRQGEQAFLTRKPKQILSAT